MGSPTSCTDWDYEGHTDYQQMVDRCALLGRVVQKFPNRLTRYGVDTRRVHKFLFNGMAPAACPCVIGNFRGWQGCTFLAGYLVQVRSDPKVGSGLQGEQPSPSVVPQLMAAFEARCQELIDSYSRWFQNKGANLPREKQIAQLSGVLAIILERFLTIHPFANGNGHVGRFLVAAVLGRFGFHTGAWPIEESLPYGGPLSDHRRLNPAPLQLFILKAATKQGKSASQAKPCPA